MPESTASSDLSVTERYRQARDHLLALRADYTTAVAQFQWPELGERFNWATDWFDAIGSGNPAPALVIVEEDGSRGSFSFDDMVYRSNQVAHWLADNGVRRGDGVALMLGNRVELWESMLAIMKLGAIILPTTIALGPADLIDRIERAGVRHVITSGVDTAKFEQVPGGYSRICVDDGPADWLDYRQAYDIVEPLFDRVDTAASENVLLYFTSGTTTRPKLVAHTNISYPLGHLSTLYWLGLQPGDVHLTISSPGWAKHAWSCFFAPWIAEATIFIYNYARFDAPALLGHIRDNKVTSFCAPPTVWRMLINSDLSGGPGSLRELVAAGEPLNPEVIRQVDRSWGLTIRDGFGQTEMTACVGNTPGSPVKAGSMGRPLPGCPVVLVDPVTESLADTGEICLDLSAHPLSLMAGYVGDPVLNADAMAGGYYHTGDVAARDAEGYITYIGRADDVFKASDYKISPFELESVLIEHPAVLEAAVVPAPDAVRLAVPKAYVALAAGYAADEETALSILQFAREHLAPYLRVRRIEFYELPKTVSGKIRRVELRNREIALAEGSETAPGEWRDDRLPRG